MEAQQLGLKMRSQTRNPGDEVFEGSGMVR
jgi:hypothetical protein